MFEYKALMTKVHIAVRELGITEKEYLNILARSFGVGSAKALSNTELKQLVDIFRRLGWRPKAPAAPKPPTREQILCWQERVRETAERLGAAWERRIRVVIEEECGVREVDWCHDIAALKRLCRRLAGGWLREMRWRRI
jgi:hypothetical protein